MKRVEHDSAAGRPFLPTVWRQQDASAFQLRFSPVTGLLNLLGGDRRG
ncbi:hypothetical protein [Deinococcus radiophilus]